MALLVRFSSLLLLLWTSSLATVNCDPKQYLLDLSHPTVTNLQKEDFEPLLNTTAKLGDPCDSMLDPYITQIHVANSTDSYLDAIRMLVQKVREEDSKGQNSSNSTSADKLDLESNVRPSLAQKSCFGFVIDGALYRPRIMACMKGICQCANKEPLVYVEDASDPTGCHVVYKKLGETCNFKEGGYSAVESGYLPSASVKTEETEYSKNNELAKTGAGIGIGTGTGIGPGAKRGGRTRFVDAYTKAAEALNRNPTVSESGEIMKNFAEDTVHQFSADLIPQNIRDSCFDDDNLMECKPNGKCGCRSLEPYFHYVEMNGTCVGKTKSVCYLEAVAKDQQTKFIFADGACADGEKCESAVDSTVVQWPVIKACGGSWGLKIKDDNSVKAKMSDSGANIPRDSVVLAFTSTPGMFIFAAIAVFENFVCSFGFGTNA